VSPVKYEQCFYIPEDDILYFYSLQNRLCGVFTLPSGMMFPTQRAYVTFARDNEAPLTA
jgi:hypothetical protein